MNFVAWSKTCLSLLSIIASILKIDFLLYIYMVIFFIENRATFSWDSMVHSCIHWKVWAHPYFSVYLYFFLSSKPQESFFLINIFIYFVEISKFANKIRRHLIWNLIFEIILLLQKQFIIFKSNFFYFNFSVICLLWLIYIFIFIYIGFHSNWHYL